MRGKRAPAQLTYTKQCHLKTLDSGLYHTISLMHVGARHLGFGTTWHDR